MYRFEKEILSKYNFALERVLTDSEKAVLSILIDTPSTPTNEIAKAMDLDPDKVTNNMSDAAIQAEIMKGMQAPQEQQEQGAVAGADAMDPTGAGGGTMGVGMVPTPGEQGFSGNNGQGIHRGVRGRDRRGGNRTALRAS